MQWSGVLKVTVTGKEHLENMAGTLIIANHPTLIDFIAIVDLVPDVNCLVKEDLWGETLGKLPVISTVSHQHIYGLLFRLLWPFSSGRVFQLATHTYPEHLLQALMTDGPGVVLIDWVDLMGSAAFNCGDAVQSLNKVKFQQVVLPGTGADLLLDWNTERGRLSFTYRNEAKIFASGELLIESGGGVSA